MLHYEVELAESNDHQDAEQTDTQSTLVKIRQKYLHFVGFEGVDHDGITVEADLEKAEDTVGYHRCTHEHVQKLDPGAPSAPSHSLLLRLVLVFCHSLLIESIIT